MCDADFCFYTHTYPVCFWTLLAFLEIHDLFLPYMTEYQTSDIYFKDFKVILVKASKIFHQKSLL